MTKEELDKLSLLAIPYDIATDDSTQIVTERYFWEEGFKAAISIIKNTKDLEPDINKFIDENFWELI